MEIPIEAQVSKSTNIVEAELVSKKSYWNSAHTHIYTVNTLKVYKVFKGESYEEINVITQGGTVGFKAEIVTPSVKFRKGTVGLLMLQSKEINLDGIAKNKTFFNTYSSVQGYYPYDLDNKSVYNTFRRFNDIETEFYQKIKTLTKRDYKEVAKLKMPENPSDAQKLSSTADIISITPTTASAGTGIILTISGTNFGSSTGTVGFKNGDAGGNNASAIPVYVDAYRDQIISWTDTQIRVKIPSFAGTGEVRVRSAGGTRTFFSDVLTILYAHLNFDLVNSSGTAVDEVGAQLYNQNGEGGYTLHLNSDFNTNADATAAYRRALNEWVCGSGVNLKLGATTPTDVAENDGENVVTFGAVTDFEDGVLATTFTYPDFCTTTVDPGFDVWAEEIDQVFNESINWNFTAANPTNAQVDFETVALHELGHAILLGHIIDVGAVMHYAIGFDSFNRTPEPNDIVGAEAMLNKSMNQICGIATMTASACSLSTEDSIADAIVIYPNPANNYLNIKSSNSISLKTINMYDMLGRNVLSKSSDFTTGLQTLNTSSLNAGIYLLEIKSADKSVTKKIIIE
ncbi:Por secretion system C-terminal sorting domain-containing protein [Flavobacteriaceae bacterium MAR_2010_188]|nr:Por secretion system C-terminal sorting domain-containing protein [Flavobacteriaceae bacterium MAR_2010_188]